MKLHPKQQCSSTDERKRLEVLLKERKSLFRYLDTDDELVMGVEDFSPERRAFVEKWVAEGNVGQVFEIPESHHAYLTFRPMKWVIFKNGAEGETMPLPWRHTW